MGTSVKNLHAMAVGATVIVFYLSACGQERKTSPADADPAPKSTQPKPGEQKTAKPESIAEKAPKSTQPKPGEQKTAKPESIAEKAPGIKGTLIYYYMPG